MVAVIKRRRVEIIGFEHERLIAVPSQIPCPVCQSPSEFLTPRQASAVAQVKTKSIYRWLAQGKAHGIRTAGGGYRICRQSLFRPLDMTSLSQE